MSAEFYAAISATVTSARMLADVVHANKTLRNFNELVGAVSEVNVKLMSVMGVALESQEKQAALAQRVRELEEEVDRLKNWDGEKERYELHEIKSGFFAYRLKPEVQANEPVHYLCTNCFAKNEKAILQLERTTMFNRYCCLRCEAKVMIL
jgi:hypothetical protein